MQTTDGPSYTTDDSGRAREGRRSSRASHDGRSVDTRRTVRRYSTDDKDRVRSKTAGEATLHDGRSVVIRRTVRRSHRASDKSNGRLQRLVWGLGFTHDGRSVVYTTDGPSFTAKCAVCPQRLYFEVEAIYTTMAGHHCVLGHPRAYPSAVALILWIQAPLATCSSLLYTSKLGKNPPLSILEP